MLIRQLDVLASADIFRAGFWKTFCLDHAETLATNPEQARDEAQELVRTAVSAGFSRARQLGVSARESLTEVFLSARAVDAGAVRAVLEFRDAFPADREMKRVLTGIGKEMGHVPREWMWLGKLLSGKGLPTSDHFASATVIPKQHRVFLTLQTAGRSESHGPDLVRALIRLTGKGDEKELAALEAVLDTFTLGPPDGPGGMSARDLDALPEALRQWILGSDLSREAFLALEFREALEQDPAGHRDTREGLLQSAHEVLDVLRRGEVDDTVFRWLRARTLRRKEREELLWNAVRSPGSRVIPVDAFLPIARHSGLDPKLAWAFRTLATGRLGTPQWARYRKDVFQQLWAHSFDPGEALELVGRMKPGARRTAFLEGVIGVHGDRVIPDLIRLAHGEAWARPLIREAAAAAPRAFRPSDVAKRRELVNQVAALHHHQLGGRGADLGSSQDPGSPEGDPGSPEAAHEHDRADPTDRGDAAPETFLLPLLQGWMPVVAAEIQARAEEGEPVDPPLVELVSRLGPEAVLEGLRRHPAAFVEVALQQASLVEVLAVAFYHPQAAGVVEGSVPREELRRAIPAIRERWARTPLLATAFEVAAAFSLRDAPFLVHLIRRTRVPESEEEVGRAFDDLYATYALPKRSGGTRLITAPDEKLKRLQRRLLDRGFNEIRLHPAATGFRTGGSTLANAEPHVGRKMVVNADIESFFPRTRHEAIVRACGELCGGRLSGRAVMFVADLCAFDGGLPTGAPTSPAIGNIVLRPVDEALTKAAARFQLEYTRYADDLTFSGDGDVHRILPFVRRVLGDYGYELKEKKVNLFRKGRRQVVTGLVVNEKPNLPRRTRRRLRAAVHHRAQGRTPHWHGRPISDEVLLGHIATLSPVQPEEARELRAQVQEARRRERDST